MYSRNVPPGYVGHYLQVSVGSAACRLRPQRHYLLGHLQALERAGCPWMERRTAKPGERVHSDRPATANGCRRSRFEAWIGSRQYRSALPLS